ncbi:MAG: hypothetical protein CSB21_00630 [Deltaproteobacteria bacterium]|nr:MAG: hypothetical protein CSB21_00630 [Deltaproteobacteria bacterium]
MKKSVRGYFILVAICSLLVMGGILNLIDVEHENKSEDFILIVFFGFWMIFGVYKIIKIKKHNTSIKDIERKKDMEDELLNIIRAYNGKVTPIEVAAESRFKINEVEEFLETMCSKGFGRIDITDSGSCVYVFEGFLSKEERDSSKSVFNI